MNGQPAGNPEANGSGTASGSLPARRLRLGWFVFDTAFGFALPVACFYCDTALLGGLGPGGSGSIVGPFRPFVYGVAWLAMGVLGAWLVLGEGLRGGSAIVAGCLAASGVVALWAACVLLPASVLLIVGGLFASEVNPTWLCLLFSGLSLAPFGTAAVLVRHAGRAFRQAKGRLRLPALTAGFLAGAALAVGVPMLL